jgi:hypothetical protein
MLFFQSIPQIFPHASRPELVYDKAGKTAGGCGDTSELEKLFSVGAAMSVGTPSQAASP